MNVRPIYGMPAPKESPRSKHDELEELKTALVQAEHDKTMLFNKCIEEKKARIRAEEERDFSLKALTILASGRAG